MLRILYSIAFLLTPLSAEPEAVTARPVAPKIDRISATEFRIGEISFDSATRSISFPATVEISNQPIEYLVVNPKGKIHEALFVTDVDPADVNVGFALLRYKPAKHLFPILTKEMTSSGVFPDVSDDVKKRARVSIAATWTDRDGKKVTRSVNELIQHRVTTKQLPSGPFTYTGSFIHAGKYQAQAQFTIASLKRDRASIINDPNQKFEDENNWLPFPKRVPEHGTPVTITISPYQGE